jgi:hypothetical protein
LKTDIASPAHAGNKAMLPVTRGRHDQTRPYRFNDDIRGVVFKATLKDIAIDGNTLVIGVSLIRLSTAIVGCCAASRGGVRRGGAPLRMSFA